MVWHVWHKVIEYSSRLNQHALSTDLKPLESGYDLIQMFKDEVTISRSQCLGTSTIVNIPISGFWHHV